MRSRYSAAAVSEPASSARPEPSGRRFRRIVWIVPAIALLGTIGAISVALNGSDTQGLGNELLDRGRVLLVGDDDVAEYARGSTEVLTEDDVRGVSLALDAEEPSALLTALAGARIETLLIDARSEPRDGDGRLRARLARYDHVEGLRAKLLTPRAAIYVVDEMTSISPGDAAAVAHIARRVLAGDRPPRIASFPEALRRVQSVEVMVLLRENGDARLWRSARGSSFARALLTAATVARQRWDERERAMGGPLDRALPYLDVEVVRLAEDGTLGARNAGFVDRVFTPVHGVGFEDRGSWHYLLPDATRERGHGSAMRAYAALFADTGYEAEALERADLRPYRLVAIPVARSPGIASPSAPEPEPAPEPGSGSPPDGPPGALGPPAPASSGAEAL